MIKNKALFFRTYKYSVSATLLSMGGSILFVLGILFSFVGMIKKENSNLTGFCLTVTALLLILIVVAKLINNRKMTKNPIKDKNLKSDIESDIASNYFLAFYYYQKAPTKNTLKYIRTLNPQFSNDIESDLEIQKHNDLQLENIKNNKITFVSEIKAPIISYSSKSVFYTVRLNAGYNWAEIISCIKNLSSLDLTINYIAAGKIGDDYETLSLHTWQDTLKKPLKIIISIL